MLVSTIVIRNFTLMIAMIVVLFAFHSGEIFAQDLIAADEGIYALGTDSPDLLGTISPDQIQLDALPGLPPSNCRSIAINSAASCTVSRACAWPPNYIFLSLSMNPPLCRYEAIINEVVGTPTPAGLAGRGSSRLMTSGRDYAFLWATKGCAFFSKSGLAQNYPFNCRPLGGPPVLADCLVCTLPIFGGGCSYCAYNWMTDAMCSGPNDTVCPMLSML